MARSRTTRRINEKAVKQADLVIAVLGLTSELEGEEMPIKVEGFAGGDRTSTDLPRAQQALLEDAGRERQAGRCWC